MKKKYTRRKWNGLLRTYHDKMIGTDEIETTTTCLGREEEDPFLRDGDIELVDQHLALVHGGAAVKLKVAYFHGLAEDGEVAEGGGVVGDDDDLLVAGSDQDLEQLPLEGHFGAEVGMAVLELHLWGKVLGDLVGDGGGTAVVAMVGLEEEVGGVAELLEQRDQRQAAGGA